MRRYIVAVLLGISTLLNVMQSSRLSQLRKEESTLRTETTNLLLKSYHDSISIEYLKEKLSDLEFDYLLSKKNNDSLQIDNFLLKTWLDQDTKTLVPNVFKNSKMGVVNKYSYRMYPKKYILNAGE